MASTPAFSSARASSTVVAVPIRNIRRAFTASRAPAGSMPKVKLNADAPLASAAARRRRDLWRRQPELRVERRHALQRRTQIWGRLGGGKRREEVDAERPRRPCPDRP